MTEHPNLVNNMLPRYAQGKAITNHFRNEPSPTAKRKIQEKILFGIYSFQREVLNIFMFLLGYTNRLHADKRSLIMMAIILFTKVNWR